VVGTDVDGAVVVLAVVEGPVVVGAVVSVETAVDPAAA